MKVLVTGGAGYIGSHAVRELLDAGHEVGVLDDLSRGHRACVPANVRLFEGDLADPELLPRALANTDAVLHFAGFLSVAESVRLEKVSGRETLRQVKELVERLGVRK